VKVVVNRGCWSFTLSAEAQIRLVEGGCRWMVGEDEVAHFNSTSNTHYGGERYNKYFAPDVRTNIRDGFSMNPGWPHSLFKGGLVYEFKYLDDDWRFCPVLIKVLEEMGTAASVQGRLEVVEIPDGIKWEIEEGDEGEYIAEEHRTW
jgi:hypothetical protein